MNAVELRRVDPARKRQQREREAAAAREAAQAAS